METYEKIICGNRYQFFNRCEGTRSGFNHISVLFCNGMEVGYARAHYINRTWESYQYRTSMRNVVYTMLADRLTRYIASYKRDNNLERLPRGAKATLEAEWKLLPPIIELNQLLESL